MAKPPTVTELAAQVAALELRIKALEDKLKGAILSYSR